MLCDRGFLENPWGWELWNFTMCQPFLLQHWIQNKGFLGLFYVSQASSHWAILLAPCRDFSLLGFRNSRLKGPVPRKASSFFQWVLQMRLELELDVSTHLWVLSWGKTGEKGAGTPPSQEQSPIYGGKVKAVSAWPCQLKEAWAFGAAKISPVAGKGRHLGIAWESTLDGLKWH